MEQEPAAAPPGLGSFPGYQLAATQVDVRASCRLSSLRNEWGLRFEEPSVFREQTMHFLQDAIW
jgi:hypothetical protein